MFVFDGEVIGF